MRLKIRCDEESWKFWHFGVKLNRALKKSKFISFRTIFFKKKKRTGRSSNKKIWIQSNTYVLSCAQVYRRIANQFNCDLSAMPARKQIIKGFYAAVYSTAYKLIKSFAQLFIRRRKGIRCKRYRVALHVRCFRMVLCRLLTYGAHIHFSFRS